MNRVFVSPSTVDRVLARNGLVLAGNPRPARSVKKPWPDWVEWRPNQLWCWDATHFMRCESQIVYGIVDIVSKKWITTLLCAEATSVQVKVVFLNALETEGLLDDLDWRADQPGDVDLTDDAAPVLLAVSDNGPEMRSDTTRTFMALMTIGQHFGRPSTPTDQAWIETLWGHIKAENPHLLTIKDPAVLAVELERVRHGYNTVRLHEAIGYVTPNDEQPRPRRSHPPSPNLWPNRRRHRPAQPPPKPAIMTTNQQQPATLKCGLNNPTICCKESDTPHYGTGPRFWQRPALRAAWSTCIRRRAAGVAGWAVYFGGRGRRGR